MANKSNLPQRLSADLQSPDEAVSQTAQVAILIERANRGEENGPEVRELRKFLDEHPEIAKAYHAVAKSVRRALMKKAVDLPGNFELFEREYAMRRDDLGYQEASPLERLLIERAGLCWIRLLWAEHYNASFMRGSVSMRESEYADKQYARAYSRYVKAIEALAKLRQVEAITRAANAQASILEIKEKSMRARIEATQPGVLSGDRGLRAVLAKRS